MRLALLVAACLAAAPADAADLMVTVAGITASAGAVRVVVIADPDGAARQETSRNLPASAAGGDGTLSTRFQGLAPGRYGVIASHDSGANHAVEKAITGKVGRASATSEPARVSLAEPSTAVTVTLR
jgi:uncharacterized protein (DUF2141 family)